MPYKYRKVCPICGKANILKLSDHLRQVHQLLVEERQPYLRSAMYCNTMATESFPQNHLEICPYPNFQLEHMFNMIVVGPTKSGKTHFVKQIRTKNCIRYPNPRKPREIYWFYNQWQDSYKTLPKQLGKEIEFIQGLRELKENMSDDLREISTDHKNIFVFDDLIGEAVDSPITSRLFTRGRHRNASFTLLLQNMFAKGKFHTDIARNTQYIVTFRSPSDRKQVDILADPIFAKHRPKFMDVYEQETEKPYGYLLNDNNQLGTAKEQQVVCDILEGCHCYPNINQSSVQLPREQTSKTQPPRKQINQPTKELSGKDSVKRPPAVPRKPPLKRSRVSQEWKDFEAYSSEEDLEQYESGQYENSEQYELED